MNLLYKPAFAIAEDILAAKVSSREVLEFFLARVEEHWDIGNLVDYFLEGIKFSLVTLRPKGPLIQPLLLQLVLFMEQYEVVGEIKDVMYTLTDKFAAEVMYEYRYEIFNIPNNRSMARRLMASRKASGWSEEI